MGISSQQYRIKTGCFCHKHSLKMPKHFYPGRKRSKNVQVISFRLFIFLTLCFVTLASANPVTDTLICDTATQVDITRPNPVKLSVNFYARYTYGNKERGLKIASWNKGGGHLQTKIHELENIVNSIHPHIFGITEANFFKHHEEDKIRIQDYEIITANTINNPNLNVSRVVVYKHKSVVSKTRVDLMDDNISSIWLEVGFPQKRKFLVCNFYREWQYLGQGLDRDSQSIHQQMARWVTFLDQWERALATGKEVICLGDFNINHLNWTKTTLPTSSQTYKLKPLINALFTRIFPHGVKQCVTVATRMWPGQENTGLDHFYTNKPQKLSEIQVQHQGSSDHKLIFGVRYAKNITRNVRYVKKRSYKTFDSLKFINECRKISWWDLYQCENVNEAVRIFSEKLTKVLDQMAPVKTFQIRSNFSPWLSEATKELMQERNISQRIASETKKPEDWLKYKILRNKVNNRLKREKVNWQKNKLENCDNDSGKLWKNVLGWLNWASSGAPSQLLHDGKIETKPSKLANVMNSFFVQKVKTIQNNLSPPKFDPISTVRKLMQNNNCQFNLQAVHPDDILKIISSLKNSKSSGVDYIDTSIIKLAKSEILPAITHIVNLSIKHSVFPSFWKTAKVIPILKKGDPCEPKNYRPVAILPILSKILEKIISQQIIQYLNENDLFHPNHHGFRANHNTTTALIQMYDTWVESVEKGELVGVCMLDMSAAFDVVDHRILLNKMKVYGFDNTAIS